MSAKRSARNVDAIVFAVISGLFLFDGWRLLDALVASATAGVPHVTIDRAVLLAGFAALIALAVATYRSGFLGYRLAVAIGAICGAMFFARSFGVALLDPQNVQWSLRGDWAEHYVSWESYRSAPWAWPPGADQNVWYPVGTSVVYTDSLPLLAMPAKIFGALLPHPFQYIGFWFAVSCVMQGVFGALLMQRMRASPAATLAGCLLFLFAPVFIWRMGHDTLTAQWLLLAALFLYLRDGIGLSFWRETLPWCALALIAALVHPYFPPMVMAIALAHWLRRVRIERERSASDATRALATMLVIVAIAWWISGAFILPLRETSGGIAYGVHTANVLTFFNSAGFSRVLPAIPGVPIEQWEGAAYFGIGVIALLIVLIVHATVVTLSGHRAPVRDDRTLWLIAALAALFAISASVRVGPWLLSHWTIDLPVFSSFRASGRFIWIAFYVVLLFAIWRTVRVFPRAAAAILVCVFALQVWDFAPIHLHFAALRAGVGWPPAEALLDDARWDELLAGRRHVMMLPPIACGKQAGSYLPFQILAARHAATFNSGYLARWNSAATLHYCESLNNDIAAKKFSVDDLYVIGPDLIDAARSDAQLNCTTLDGYLACVVARTGN